MLETIVHKEKPRQQPDSERYVRLRARLLDEMGRGATLRRMARELVDYGLHFSFYAHDEATARVLGCSCRAGRSSGQRGRYRPAVRP